MDDLEQGLKRLHEDSTLLRTRTDPAISDFTGCDGISWSVHSLKTTFTCWPSNTAVWTYPAAWPNWNRPSCGKTLCFTKLSSKSTRESKSFDGPHFRPREFFSKWPKNGADLSSSTSETLTTECGVYGDGCLCGCANAAARGRGLEPMARNMTVADIGFLCGCEYLLHDRDGKSGT